MRTRREARESALKALYYFDSADTWSQEAVKNFERCFLADERDDAPLFAFFRKLIQGYLINRNMLDDAIEQASERWRLPRMSMVDRNIIRIACYELHFEIQTPINVVINEAIEIAKLYGDRNSAGFVNGVIDKIAAGVKSRVAA